MNYITAIASTILAVGCTACGARDTEIDAELKPYVDEFMSITAGQSHTHIDRISFSLPGDNLLGSHAGVCIFDGAYSDLTVQPIREIRIRKGYWNNLSEGSRAVLVFHEMVHCSLGVKGHDNTELMGTAIQSEKYTMEQARELLREWIR